MSASDIRQRLVMLRDELRRRFAEADALDAGLLATLADVETVLAGLDRDGVGNIAAECSSKVKRRGVAIRSQNNAGAEIRLCASCIT